MVAKQGKAILVKSPSGAKDATFYWSDDEFMNEKDFDENMDIVDSIKWIVSDIHELRSDNDVIKLFRMVDSCNYESVAQLANIYNEKIEKIRHHWATKNMTPGFTQRHATRGHLKHIIQQCYNRAVGDAEKLNQYLPFSPEVYGETSFELIAQMIQYVRIAEEDSFIDLGSGVGQVVLQVAASTKVKSCIGVEKAEYPAMCAEALGKEFRYWMAFYGKPYQPFSLLKDDFLEDRNRDNITNATVIFANNFAFGPNVDHQLKLRFANLREGARVISSKAFCPLNFRITDRNLSDIGSIMYVQSLNPLQDAVSWTDKPFSYFVHTIDRSSLEDYFAKLKNPQLKEPPTVSQLRKDRKGRVSDKDINPVNRIPGYGRKASNAGSSSDYDTADEEQESSVDHQGTDDSCSNSQFDALAMRQQFLLSSKIGRGARPNAPSALANRLSLPTGKRVATTMNDQPNKLRKIEGLPSRHNRGVAAKNRRNKLLQENEGLQMLHASTVNSVETSSREKMSDHNSTLYNSPVMLHFANKYQPRELHGVQEASRSAVDDTDHRLFQQNDVVPYALLQYLELIKQSFMTHFSRMRSVDYRSKLEQDIAEQRAKNDQLKSCINKIEDSIADQHKEGKTLLNAFLKKVGINVDTPLQFFGEARKLIKNNHMLEVKIENIKKQITTLQSENENLQSDFQKLNQKQFQHSTTAKPSFQKSTAQISAEEQHRILAEHVQKLKQIEELQQIAQLKNGTLTVKPINGIASSSQKELLSTTAPKKERKKYQPRGQGSPNKAKKYPGPGRPKKVALIDDCVNQTSNGSSQSTGGGVTKSGSSSFSSLLTPQIINSITNNPNQTVKLSSSNLISKNFMHTSLEELIKQEIMRPSTPLNNRGSSITHKQANPSTCSSSAISQSTTIAGSSVVGTQATNRGTSAGINSLLKASQTFTLIPVTLCQSSTSSQSLSTAANNLGTHSINSNPGITPQTQLKLMEINRPKMIEEAHLLLNCGNPNPSSNNSKPPILQPMSAVIDNEPVLPTGGSHNARTEHSHSSSPPTSLNSNTPRSVETLSAYSPVSRPPSIESGKTPPSSVSQRSPAGSLCNLPLSNLPPRKRGHYESFNSSNAMTDNNLVSDHCSSPKIMSLLSDSSAPPKLQHDTKVRLENESFRSTQFDPSHQSVVSSMLQRHIYSASPPILAQSNHHLPQSDSADHLIPCSPPTLKAVEYSEDCSTDKASCPS